MMNNAQGYTPQASTRILKDAYFQSTAWLYAYTESKGIRSLKTHIIFCVIYSHAISSGAHNAAYYGTLETLQFWTRSADRGTVIKGLKELEAAGMIRKVTYQKNGPARPAYIANVAEATAFRDALAGDRDRGTMNCPIDESGKNPQWENSTLKNSTHTVEKFNTPLLKNPTPNNTMKEYENNRVMSSYAHAQDEDRAETGLGAPPAVLYPQNAQEVAAYIKSLATCPPSPTAEEIATSFFDNFEATGWLNSKGIPIRDWRAMARVYLNGALNNIRAERYQQRQNTQPTQAPQQEAPKQPQQLTEEVKTQIREYTDAIVKEKGIEEGLQYCWKCDLGKPYTPKTEQAYWREYIAEKYGITNFTPQTEKQQ